MSQSVVFRVSSSAALLLALNASAGWVLADEVTISQPVVELRYNADADYTWFIGPARWGAPSCPNAYYAQVPAGVAGRDKLLAIVLAAKATGSSVSFQGNCSGDSLYFNVNYVVVAQ